MTVRKETYHTDAKTSTRMKGIASSGSKIEMRMEKILMESGLRFTAHPKMYGNSDFVLDDFKVAIFCDSSFWHGRNPKDVSGKSFTRNKDLWVRKLTKTMERDKTINEKLTASGWKVLRFWDDEILKYPNDCLKKILSYSNVKTV